MKQKDLEYYLSQIRRIAEHRETDAEEKIKEVYKKLKADLRHFVADYYADHGEDDRLSFDILNRKRQYARFIEEAVKITDDHLPEIKEDIEKVVDDTYKITFDGMTDAVKRSVSSDELKENLKGVKAATPEQIRAGVLNDVSGITPEMTYTKDRATFIYELQKQLNIGLANGDRYTTMAKRIAQRCDIAYRRSLLIARTETHRVREKGFLDSGLELNGVLKQSSTPIRLVKTWQSMQDERVRDTKEANHRMVNGESKELDEEFTLLNGVKAKAPGQSGTPYNDCNCRCILVYELKDITGKTTKKTVDKKAESGIIEAKEVQEIPLEKLKQSGMSTSDFEAYSKMIAEHENQDIRNLYSKYADKVDKMKSGNDGYYRKVDNSIVFDYPKYSDMNKYGTLAHEYGHFFDAKAKYDGLAFKEIEGVYKNTNLKTFDNVASSSDNFLVAVRKDKEHLEKIYLKEKREYKEVIDSEFNKNNASHGVQDAIDGLFAQSRIRWGHGEKYYNRKYSSVKSLEKMTGAPLTKHLQQFYKDMGFDASNQTKVKNIVRQYDAASEMWANIMSAIVCGGDELNFIKKYLPNSYKAMLEILKKVI